MYDARMCAFSAKSKSIIDLMHLTENDGYRSHCFGDSLAQMKQRYPDVELMTVERAANYINEAFREPVKEISESDYFQMLEVLPPDDWRSVGGVESFKMIERTCGSITSIYATTKGRYFHLADDFTTPAYLITSKIKAFLEGDS